jgi:hypothetical protein
VRWMGWWRCTCTPLCAFDVARSTLHCPLVDCSGFGLSCPSFPEPAAAPVTPTLTLLQSWRLPLLLEQLRAKWRSRIISPSQETRLCKRCCRRRVSHTRAGQVVGKLDAADVLCGCLDHWAARCGSQPRACGSQSYPLTAKLTPGSSAHLCVCFISGDNVPSPEVVMFSDFVLKINRKEKEQTRVILVTNKAVYNLLPSAYGKCKRRIALESIASVTASSISDEFVLHVPEEYDYRFKSAKKDFVCELVVKLFKNLWEAQEKKDQAAAGPGVKIKKKRIHCAYVNEPDLKEHALTKQMARLQTREDVLRKKQIAQSAEGDSDQEEQTKKAGAGGSASASSAGAGSGGDEMENLLEGTEKVKLEDFELLKVLGRGSFVRHQAHAVGRKRGKPPLALFQCICSHFACGRSLTVSVVCLPSFSSCRAR